MTREKDELENVKEAATFTAGGVAAGAGVSALVGGMGLAVGGTAIAIGMAPVAVAGGVLGLAAYGAKQALRPKRKTGKRKIR